MLDQRGKLHEVEVAYIAGHVIDAMRFLHKKFILHRDLRLPNLLLTKDMNVKVIDFDIAKELTSDVGITKSQVGLPQYWSPEMIDIDCGYGMDTNLWFLGLIIYELLTGNLPWGKGMKR
mgnify:CR=1 FL=1